MSTMHRMMIVFSALVLVSAGTVACGESPEYPSPRGGKVMCDAWWATVDPKVRTSSNLPDVEQLSDSDAVNGVECLLALEGNHRRGKFSGSTRLDISQLFPDATVEIDALYMISAIYHRRWAHARGIALVDERPLIVRPNTAAKRAFPFVRQWFERLKSEGLEKLRERMDDPLNGSGLRWY